MTKRLGRGLADLIEPSAKTASNYVMLQSAQIRPGRFQPRTSMNDTALEELKASIRRQGIVEPVIVRPLAHGTYELVAGERRWRAAQALGMKDVPAIIKPLNDRQALEFSLVENIQRENLNPIEEARGFARLLDEFGYTQEDIAAAVSKDRASVANTLRLLKLPPELQQALLDGAISMGHAKVLLAVEGRARQVALSARVVKEHLSVRQLEALAGAATSSARRGARRADPELKALEDRLRQALGTKVSLVARAKGGKIIIDYYSADDLSRLIRALGVAA
jgi:ParB family chromosome partitioning protein